MIVGIPTETKRDEYRVGLLPVGVEELTRAGHPVLVELGAGLGSGLTDDDCARHGAKMIDGPSELFGRTSTFALCNVTLPWVLHMANRGLLDAATTLPPVARAINIFEGEVTNRPVAETFGMAYNPRFES